MSRARPVRLDNSQVTISTTSRRAVFLDIDGTLTDGLGNVPPSAAAAIHAAQSRGHLVFLATGRSPLEIDPRVEEIGFDGMVAGAGAYVQHAGTWLVDLHLDEADARSLAAELDDLGIDYSLQGRHGMHTTEGHRSRMRRLLTGFGYTDIENSGLRHHVVDSGPMKFDQTAKVVFSSDDEASFDRVQARLGSAYAIVGGTMPGLGNGGGEISMRGVHKAAAIEALLPVLGLGMEDTIAVGDSGNDLEMLVACGVGVAMGNGTAEAKAAADLVTGAVDEDGLHAAFVRLGLIEAHAGR
ncbi:Cof-type HAD-IIB family hydrolase [Pseudoclavibacter sp. RFBI5]|nr:Cof-type HAD-IIB family hydrolase [Pseudoclavibacter sp. RFBI5]